MTPSISNLRAAGICGSLVVVLMLPAAASAQSAADGSRVRGLYNPRSAPTGPIAAGPATFDAPSVPASPSPAVDAARGGAPTTEAQPLEGGQIIARIDGQVVLAGDILWQVNQLIEMNRDRIPPSEEPALRKSLLERQVLQLVDTKLLFADFRRTVPSENWPKVEEGLAKPFREHEIPRMIKAMELENRAELEAKLQTFGTNMKEVQRQFTERTIAGEWLRQKTPKPKEVTHQEMLSHYQENLAEYEYPAQARWEELMVSFARHNGDKAAAWQDLAEMGNEVWTKVLLNPSVRGPVFGEVARQGSDGFTAADGGEHDWTTIGALKCEAINEALGSLEIGQLSDGIASERGYHIVRVLERKTAGRTPFTEAQQEIREQLQKVRREELVDQQIKKLRREARVWTIFHGDLNADQIAELLNQSRQR